MNTKPIIDLTQNTWDYFDSQIKGTSPYIKFYHHYVFDTLGIHKHNFYEINIIINGSGAHEIEGQRCHAEKGSVFVIPPNIRHGYRADTKMDVYHILLSDIFMAKYSAELDKIDGYSILFEIEPILRQTTDKYIFLNLDAVHQDTVLSMIRILESNINTSEKVHIYLVLGIIGFLSNEMLAIKKREHSVEAPWFPQMVKSMEYIRNNCNQKINFKELAVQYNFSYMTYLRNFEKLCSVTPSAFQSECRIKKSINMLREGHTVLETALECGFYDSSHFIRVFKSMQGISPNELRQPKKDHDT